MTKVVVQHLYQGWISKGFRESVQNSDYQEVPEFFRALMLNRKFAKFPNNEQTAGGAVKYIFPRVLIRGGHLFV